MVCLNLQACSKRTNSYAGDPYYSKPLQDLSGGSRILYGRVARWPKKNFKAHSAEKIF